MTIVGEAPGREEVQHREGFVGRAGRLLDKILHIGGLDRSQVNLSNVAKRAPDGGYDSDHFKETFYETTAEIIVTEKRLGGVRLNPLANFNFA